MHTPTCIRNSVITAALPFTRKVTSVASQNKRILFSMLLFCFCLSSIAQTHPFPSKFYTLKTNGDKAAYLRKVIGDSVSASAYRNVPGWCHAALALTAKSANDTLSPILYQFLGDSYDGKKYDSAAYYYRLSLATFKNINIKKKLYLQQSLLYVYANWDKKDSILYYINELKKTIAVLPDTNRNKLNVTNTIASSYGDINQYENAIQNYRFVIRQSLKINDSATLRNALVNTGLVYNETGNDRMAIYYTQQALPYLGNEPYTNMTVYANLADYYTSLSILDSAKYFLVKAEALAKQSEDEEVINSLSFRRANILADEKKYAAAEPLLQKSLAFFKQQPPGLNLVNCLLISAGLDTSLNRYEKAKEHLLSLYSITKAMNKKAYLAETLNFLASVNERLGDYKNAYAFQKEFIAINETIKDDKAAHALAELQTQYQTIKKEDQINILQKESIIKNLELQAALRNKSLFIVLSIILIVVFASILYVRHLRSKTALQNLKAELEMKALRSQMNPHFIFNSLNSIQKYIWENRQEDASEYLTKFARLIRLVLENSLHSSVKLAEELNALRLYIEMEHRRNNQKFDYSITVSENIDEDNTHIPPLLLQPYVENAIWHGLSQKDGRGKLSVAIERSNGSLICIIDDDGIGRKKASEIKANTSQKTSLAMNISSQRIDWLKKDAGLNASVNITDKYKGNNADGTTVLLTLPFS